MSPESNGLTGRFNKGDTNLSATFSDILGKVVITLGAGLDQHIGAEGLGVADPNDLVDWWPEGLLSSLSMS